LKKIITGSCILLTGALLFLSVFIAGSNIATLLNSWDSRSGRFWSAVSDANLYPVLVISIVAMLAGIVILILGHFDKSDKI